MRIKIIFEKVSEWLNVIKSWCDNIIEDIRSLGKNEDEELSEFEEDDDDEYDVDPKYFDVEAYIAQHTVVLKKEISAEIEEFDTYADEVKAIDDKVYQAIKNSFSRVVDSVTNECILHGLDKDRSTDIALHIVRLIVIRSANNIILYAYKGIRNADIDIDLLKRIIKRARRIACIDYCTQNKTLEIDKYVNSDTMHCIFNNVFVETLDSIMQVIDICMPYCMSKQRRDAREYMLDRIRSAITRCEEQLLTNKNNDKEGETENE